MDNNCKGYLIFVRIAKIDHSNQPHIIGQSTASLPVDSFNGASFQLRSLAQGAAIDALNMALSSPAEKSSDKSNEYIADMLFQLASMVRNKEAINVKLSQGNVGTKSMIHIQYEKIGQ